MTGDWKQHYHEIRRYVDNYCKHIYDITIQKQMLEEFWNECCVYKCRVLGVSFTRHNEAAKDKWSELDHMVRCSENNLGESL